MTPKTIFITALPFEGSAITDHLKLKRRPGPFSVFESDRFLLAVTGVGKTRCAAVTAAVLSGLPSHAIELIVNIGIVGSTIPHYLVGNLFSIHKIIDGHSGRTYFPDMIAASEIPEETVTTFDKAVDSHTSQRPASGLVDMEAAGFFEAASLFAAPHQIACFKIVSDHLNPAVDVSPSRVTQLIANAMPGIMTHVTRLQQCTARDRVIELQSPHIAYLQNIARNWRTTATQDAMLREALRHFVNTHPDAPLPDVPVSHNPKTTKQQRNDFIAQLQSKLLR